MYKNQLQSYETVPTEGNPTQSEAWALLQASVKMRDAVAHGSVEEMKAAVRLNWRLWTIFQADLLAPTCEVPQDIRQNVLSLAKFIDQHSVEFFSNPEPEKVEVLVNINREIAGGLSDGARYVAQQQQNQELTASTTAYAQEASDTGAATSHDEGTPPPAINLTDLEA